MSSEVTSNNEPSSSGFWLAGLPEKLDEAAELLDANLTKVEHAQKLPDDHWTTAIKTRRLCRIPSFRASYDGAWPHFGTGKASIFRATLHDRCLENGKKIEDTGSKFAVGQIDDALSGSNINFERAVVIVYSFNQLVAEEVERLANQEAANTEAINALHASILPLHCISACCFYFHDIAPVFLAAAAAKGGEGALLREIATAIDQPYEVVRALLGRDPSKAKKSDAAGKVHACGSYVTLRAIYKQLEAISSASVILADYPRDHHIQRFHVKTGNKTATNAEKIAESRRVTRPPYNWGKPADGEDEYPS